MNGSNTDKRIYFDMQMKAVVLIITVVKLVICIWKEIAVPEWMMPLDTMIICYFFRKSPKEADKPKE